MKQNIELDAALIRASMAGLIEPFAIGTGMTPDDVQRRADWLRRANNKDYLGKVIAKIVADEQETK